MPIMLTAPVNAKPPHGVGIPLVRALGSARGHDIRAVHAPSFQPLIHRRSPRPNEEKPRSLGGSKMKPSLDFDAHGRGVA